MTDQTPIDVKSAVALEKTLSGILDAVKGATNASAEARNVATDMRKALDQALANAADDKKKFSTEFSDTSAKIKELSTELATKVGSISEQEMRIKSLGEEAEKHRKAIDDIVAEMRRPKDSDNKSADERRAEVKAALAFFNAKHWQKIDGQGIDEGIRDLNGDWLTEERLKEYQLGREVMAKMFRMGKSIGQGREGEFLGSVDERKALSTFTMGNRYWLQTELSDRIIACYRLDTDMTQFVSNLSISRGAIELMTDHYVGQDAQWKCELDCAPKKTATEPLPGTIIITANELTADECITHTMIEDSAISPEDWLAQKVGGKFIRKINNSILVGDGNQKPDGILRPNNHLTMESGNVDGTPSGDFTWQDLVLMSIKLEPRFRANSVWWFGTNALASTMTMTDSQGRPIWSAAVLNEQGLPRIMGKPVVEVTQMPDYLDGSGAKLVGSKPIALGDWKQAYMLVHRRGFTAMRDPYSMMQCGVRWHFSQRVGGGVLCRNASLFMQIK